VTFVTLLEVHGWPDGFGLTGDARRTLRGRTVWITGGGTGFGRAVAIAVGLCGGRVIVSGRRPDRLRETVDEGIQLGVTGDRFMCLPMDMTSARREVPDYSSELARGVKGLRVGLPKE